jgi:hypothetical protein
MERLPEAARVPESPKAAVPAIVPARTTTANADDHSLFIAQKPPPAER